MSKIPMIREFGAGITSNTTNISSNDVDIASNDADISALQSAIPANNRIQTKILGITNITSDGNIAALQFNSLTIGKWYTVTGQVALQQDAGSSNEDISFYAYNNGQIQTQLRIFIREGSDSSSDLVYMPISFTFQAAATNLQFHAGSAGAGSYIEGNNSRARTYVQIEERNDLESTTAFS